MVSKSPERTNAKDDQVPVKKLSAEELEKSTQRLTKPYPPAQEKDAVTLSPRILKSKEDIDQSVERLYRQGMEHLKKQREDAAQHQYDKFTPTKVVRTREELDDGLGRLYTQAIESKKMSDSKAREKFLYNYKAKTAGLTVEELTARVYTESIKKHGEENQRLQDKYIDGTAVKCRKMSPNEVKASAERLTAKK